jgi:hypothetical protein
VRYLDGPGVRVGLRPAVAVVVRHRRYRAWGAACLTAGGFEFGIAFEVGSWEFLAVGVVAFLVGVVLVGALD